MDNITHSLVGILTAESALEVLRIRQPNTVLTRKTRIAFWLSALLANNFCDLDFIPTLFLEPKRLQYLLHHRGHTHTLLLAPLQALIILLGFWGWGQWKKISWEKHEKVGVSFLTLLGVVLHLFLDFLNQYGVHPFWPFYNGWFYADMMFIVEPWIWLTLLPLLWFSTRHRWVRAGVGGLLISACALLALSGFVPKTMAFLVTLWGAGLMLVFAYVSHRFRLSIAYFMLGVVGLIFGLESYGLKKEILNRFKLEEPSVTVNDIILSPFPSNPICWQVVTVETFSKREFFR
ncbi:MAG: metal-dependent hydrolase, partial [Deltaproteobacteria bacterium]